MNVELYIYFDIVHLLFIVVQNMNFKQIIRSIYSI